MVSKTYSKLKGFKKKYPMTIAWRIKRHAKIIDKHLNDNEEVLYAFLGQKNSNHFDIVNTNAVVITNKRLLLGSKRLLWGYFLTSITPDLFNDLKIEGGLIFGKVTIDTVKELVVLSSVDKNALAEIETEVTTKMIKQKKRMFQKNDTDIKSDI